MMALLSTKIHRFTILIGSNIFPLLAPTLVPMSLYGTCPISLLSVGLSLRFYLLKISLISTYKMPSHLLSNLLIALSNLSPNIRNIGISSGRHGNFRKPEVT